MPSKRTIARVVLILGLGLSQSACIATAVGVVAGTAIGVTGKAVGMTAKGAGMAVGAVLPHDHKKDDARR